MHWLLSGIGYRKEQKSIQCPKQDSYTNSCVYALFSLPCGVIVWIGLPWPLMFHMVRVPSE